ncbi:MAG TPA: pyridoxal kinase PdxY [Pseudolabrys sp.]|nr:pyridoxal kinase PdxY [Pseudolabrys sp.]
MNILSVQSHVVYGHVGNCAAVFPLRRIGIEVWPINTVQFSNHTGYGEWKGASLDPTTIRDLVTGLESRGVLGECDGVLSGYIGSAEIGAAILGAVDTVKRANAAARYCCDPVIGDAGRSSFVKPGVAAFIKSSLVPAADVLTPNQFELDYLSGHESKTLAQTVSAIDSLHMQGPRAVLVTSLHVDQTPEDCIDVVASDPTGLYRVRTPRLEMVANGAGDLIAGLFFARYLRNGRIDEALSLATSAVFCVLAKTVEAGAAEMQLVAAQDEFANPSRVFEASPLGS